jgi:hypothetical protein
MKRTICFGQFSHGPESDFLHYLHGKHFHSPQLPQSTGLCVLLEHSDKSEIINATLKIRILFLLRIKTKN